MWTLQLAKGDSPVQADDGRVVDGKKYVVPADDGLPVGVFPRPGQCVAGGDGGLRGVEVRCRGRPA